MSKEIIIASGNPGKLREFRQMLEPAGYIVSPQSEFNVSEADEPYFSFVENAIEQGTSCFKIDRQTGTRR